MYCLTDIKCPVLESIANGSVNNDGIGSWGTKVKYSCDEGYSLVGASSRKCQGNGTWDYMAPMCRGELPNTLKHIIVTILSIFSSREMDIEI